MGLLWPLQSRRSELSPALSTDHQTLLPATVAAKGTDSHWLIGHDLSSHERDTRVNIKMTWECGATRQSLAYEDSAWGLAVIYRHTDLMGHMWSPMLWESLAFEFL